MGRVIEPKTNLRRAMILRGMDESHLAVATGIPVNTIRLVAGGFQKMRPDRVAKVAEALNVTPEELSDVTGSRSGGSTAHLAPKKEPEVKLPEPKVKPKPYAEKSEDVEKLWLYFHQLNRRVITLEAELRELKEGK